MKPGRTWAALDVEYRTRDAAILGLRREIGKALVAMWWPALICECKKGGSTLTAVVDLRELADELGDERSDTEIAGMLQRFVDRALLDVAGGALDDGVVLLRLHSGDDWQVAAGTKRSRKSRSKPTTDDEPTKKPPTKKPAQKRKPAAAASKATPTQRTATPRNTTQPSRARTERDSETETDTDKKVSVSSISDAPRARPPSTAAHPERAGAEHAERPRGSGRGKLDANVEASVDRLLALMPPGDDGRRVFFDLAHRGATEADFQDAVGAIREVEDVKDRPKYACRVLQNRLAARGLVGAQ